ncbi:bifunctional N-acetylglucosamine-1-phosphate uridyltransferase/glucosamine-1-phosphate acetyltransferase [Candidatus Pseudothioglobus singularis]|jgi:bifunctional UDP-N-acetylglucosamine pyrophosphorylase/glucosamine-1-phosphate N-acetyltransferase|uniref:bifunctional UDP-N-acetylglucosamine diphosphorylase/glucosamine-1-phosphate N-acetyltransferase GlmU n=1 Tax=Candidatus Pseudothioglobus singularis TaxID=1427364 RepID=UPI0008060875|nr:bifunctional UDP-N-acetylglucosamine diphosphorylase/glucosamine-1-phosphate N-acetyltransferase GlmU [Candidatus Pseudothioglobus singularis]ANQ67114.1 bifunctional N-acetylglucosamine-1-phosphate uridyltransferase/glucosamine-1-phosphate acetyltransferase [Candidatus Pseudothioglobus singularis]MDG1345745.1 bifunctional UDP-N-acetylglucosamine diphosphorylase/glucosamine-1-phosphate N-acetyltransferase GlmU [Candidatus Thioglobus sp.]MDG1956260.1 bifunctional UDP-N-acetylglucosamine diphosp|tara:strand:- start:4703 stop:6058 length:1356 start_codon:yes stop_codon:yes gene_type:complete
MNTAIILAAGQGTRMNSQTAKVLHKVGNKSLLQHVIDASRPLVNSINVIIGHHSESVKKTTSNDDINWVNQKEQLGTGHAVQQAIPHINDNSICLILYGDVPLIKTETLQILTDKAESSGFSLLSVMMENPFGYGRIIRDSNNSILSIVEQKDASKDELQVREINTGIMAIRGSILKKYLKELEPNNSQGELYLTDIVEKAVKDNVNIASFICESVAEVMGINDKNQLSQAERAYQQNKASDLMSKGLTIMDPKRFDCRGELSFKDDCVIDVNVVFEGDNDLGKNVLISPNCIIKASKIGDNTHILANSIIENAVIGSNTSIGPFARIRPETKIGNHSKIGNFVEVKKSSIENNSKVSHLSYIGDSKIGNDVNVGAGVITCNYDGINKFQTEIKDGAFVGSNSQLVAPVTIGKNATIGAGSTITQNTPDGQLTLSRNKQSTISKWKRPLKK